ncbi:porin [Gimesia panareensis]|nr:porin [Gimesia panareensis]
MAIAGLLTIHLPVSQADHPPAPAAANADLSSQLQSLQQQIDQLKAQQIVTVQNIDQPATEPMMQAPDEYDSDLPPYLFGDNTACPEFPTVRLTGFFQADSVWFGQDSKSIQAVGDVQNGADFRRARLAATGDAWENVGYMLEMDFAFPGRPSFMDVWMEVRDVLGGNNVRIGQYRQPIGMDALTSVKELTFLERALPFAFLPFRQIGAMYFGNTADEQTRGSFKTQNYVNSLV